MTPEKRVQNSIMEFLRKLYVAGKPLLYGRRQAGGFSYIVGSADLWACMGGKHLEIEVKAPGKTMRPMQVKWKMRSEAAGALHVCVDSLDDFKSFIHENFPEVF